MKTRQLTHVQAELELAGVPLELQTRGSALGALRFVCANILELPEDAVPLSVRVRVGDLLRLLDDPEPVAPPRPAGAEPTPITRPAHRSDRAWCRKHLRGPWRDLVDAALDSGFVPELTHGGSRLRFLAPPPSPELFVIPRHPQDGDQRGLLNARAQARRAGVQL